MSDNECSHEWTLNTSGGLWTCSHCHGIWKPTPDTVSFGVVDRYAGFLDFGGVPVVFVPEGAEEYVTVTEKHAPKCECGAAAVGAEPFKAGHSAWCPVSGVKP